MKRITQIENQMIKEEWFGKGVNCFQILMDWISVLVGVMSVSLPTAMCFPEK